MLNKWNQWYKNLSKEPTEGLYGGPSTYVLGAEFLEDCNTVEDWGTGTGAFKLYRENAIGIDGSDTPHADKKVDLTEYESCCDGIFMRHVLEHNAEWKKIVKNALKSAHKKVCIVFDTPLNEGATVDIVEISTCNKKHGVDVKTYSLGKEFRKALKGHKVKKIMCGTETIFYVTKGNHEDK